MKAPYLALALCLWPALAPADALVPDPIFGLGTGDNGAYQVTVTTLDTVSVLGTGVFEITEGPYLCFSVVIENITAEPNTAILDINDYDFGLVCLDSQAFRYDIEQPFEIGWAIDSQGDAFTADELGPGQRTSGMVAFPLGDYASIDLVFDPIFYDPITFKVALLTASPQMSWGAVKHRF